jgi:peptidoglycan/LPS O-acetylase OafA/YrhL
MGGIFRLEGHSDPLQSLRGIAALSVAVGHAFTVMSNGRIEDAHFALRPGNALLTAGEVLIQPNTAVVLFYVLSGFVLGESLRRRTAASELGHFGAFALRRLWRLLPVMWLSILFAVGAAILLRGALFAGTTAWFNQFSSVATSPAILLQNLLGLSHSINSVLWSIQIELVMIVLLPPLVWLSARSSPFGDAIVVGALYLAAIEFWGVAPTVVSFIYCFYLGVALPKFLSNAATARWLGNGFGVFAALALLVPIEYLYVSGRLWLPYKFLVDALVSFHVIAFVLLRRDSGGARLLERPVLVWLGDVSYSFYCYAMSVLLVVAWVTIVPAPIATSDAGATGIVLAAAILCVAISLVFARFSFTLVEKPGMRLGRAWSKRIEGGGAPSAPAFAATAIRYAPSKIASGSSAETTQLGTSTTLDTLKSTATLQMM